MTGPVVPSGADFDEDRDLGGHRTGRLSRFIERVRSGPKRDATASARVEDGVGEGLRVAEFEGARRPTMPKVENPSAKSTAPEERTMTPTAKPRRTGKRVVVDDTIAAQPTADDDATYRGTWNHERGSQRNVRDTIDPERDISYYND